MVNSVVIERNRLWKQDFEIPKKYGIRHTLSENGGPGGLFFTLRTISLILDIVHDMEEFCPQATFINFSNPESRIILALGRYAKVCCIGLCHGIFMAQNDVAEIMGLDPKDVDVSGAGLNHFQWLMDIRHTSTGEDLYPLLAQKEANSEGTLEVIENLAGAGNEYHLAANVPNIGQITNLPLGAMVETPVVLSGMGIQPAAVGALPDGITEILRRELAVVKLCVDTAVRGDRQLALQALLLDPVITDIDVARDILDDYLTPYKQYLPQYWK